MYYKTLLALLSLTIVGEFIVIFLAIRRRLFKLFIFLFCLALISTAVTLGMISYVDRHVE